MAEASPFYYWGYPYYYHPLKLGPKHEWVEGYGYAIPQAKAAEERKKREAEPQMTMFMKVHNPFIRHWFNFYVQLRVNSFTN